MTNPETILVVDDQPRLLDLLRQTLKLAGYQVLAASNGRDALTILESQSVDLILADIAMPHMNGYQLYERIQENPSWVPIPFLFLTARSMDSDIRYGKQLGVDDYLTKPIEPEDLLAAVQGKLRRAQQLAKAPIRSVNSSHIFVEGQLRIDSAQHRVWLNEQPIDLSAREFRLLKSLAQNAGTVMPLQQLIKETHNLETHYSDASALLRPLIRSLRRKMGYSAGEMGCIESVRGVGYQLIPARLRG